MARNVSQYQPSRKARAYIKQIQLSWQSAFNSIIKVGHILQKAKTELDQREWHEMISHELPFTRRTAEKLIKIADDPRITDPKNVSILPPRWTSLEAITRLSNRQFRDAVKNGVIHAEAERKDIEAIISPTKPKTKPKSLASEPKVSIPATSQPSLSPSQLALQQNDHRRPVDGQPTEVVVAELTTDRELSKKEAADLEKALTALSAEHDVSLKLSGNLKEQALIKKLERQLRQKEDDLKRDARDHDLAAITDAFYQFETGKNFPKNPDGSFKKNDLRNPSNVFGDFDKEQLYGYCLDLQLLTQYTPLEFLDPAAFKQLLRWRFLTGNELQKTEALRTLEQLELRGRADKRRSEKKRGITQKERQLASEALKRLNER